MSDEISLKALRAFDQVARLGSFSRAALAMGVAQSVVSRRLAEAEAGLGGALFHRTGRGVQLSALGSATIGDVRGLLARADALATEARDRSGQPSGLVALGIVPSVAAPLASALQALVARHHPRVRLRVLEGYSGEIEQALADGRVELAVVNRYRARGTGVYRSLHAGPLCIVGRREVLQPALADGPRRPLPESTTLPRLARLRLVLPVPPNPVRALLEHEAGRLGIEPDVMMEAASSAVIKRMLHEHDCATLLPSIAVTDELAAGRLCAVPLQERSMRQHVVLVTSAQRPFTLAARALADLLPQAMATVLGRAAGPDRAARAQPAARPMK